MTARQARQEKESLEVIFQICLNDAASAPEGGKMQRSKRTDHTKTEQTSVHKTTDNSKTSEDPYKIGEDTGFACSAHDCTGLIPSLPESEAQIEMYQELFPYMAKAETPKREKAEKE